MSSAVSVPKRDSQRPSDNVAELPEVLAEPRASFFGICFCHVWIFCAIHRGGIDYGGVPITFAIYVSLCIFCAIGAIITASEPTRSERLSKADWIMALLMSAATFFLTVQTPLSGAATAIAASVMGGVGIGWLYMRWAMFYANLSIKNAVACIFGALCVGSLIKAATDLMPMIPGALVCMASPLLTMFALHDAERHRPPCKPSMQLYTSVISLWPIVAGASVYAFITGVVQGADIVADPFPLWALVCMQHIPESLAGALVIWWVFVHKGSINASVLWRVILLFTATSLLLLPMLGPGLSGQAQAILGIAQALIVMLYWATIADIAHHSSFNSAFTFCICWLFYCVPFVGGHLVAMALGDQVISWPVSAVLIFVSAIALAFLLNESVFDHERVFADLANPLPRPTDYATIDEKCRALGEARGLSQREVEIVSLLAKGHSKGYIAENLHIAENTVRSHAKRIYSKLDIHSVKELMELLGLL